MPRLDTELASVLGVLEPGSRTLPEQLHIAQGLIEVLPIPVFFKSRDGRYLGVNRAWEAFFGVRREDMLGGNVHDLYREAPQVAERHQAMDEALWDAPGTQSYEITLTTPQGAARHTIYYKATFARADGEIAGLIGTIVDITERKRAEQREAIENAVGQYLGSAAPLHEAIRGIIQAMCERLEWACGARWSLDDNDHLLHCVETWSVDDAAIRHFQEVSGRETFLPGETGLIRRVLTTGTSMWVEDVTRTPGFQRAGLAAEAGLRGAFALPVTLGERVLGAIEFFSRDVRQPDKWMLQVAQSVGNQIGQLMARRQAEHATRESEGRFRSLTELSSDWYWEQDAEYRFVQVSRGITESIHIPQEAFIGKRRWELDVVGLAPEDMRAHIAALHAHQTFQDFEFGTRDAAGQVHWVSVSGQPIFDEEGRFTGYRGIGKDITRRKTDEAALRAAHDELERRAGELTRSNDELQQFAYVASHDLQEPLRMISSYTQLIVRRYDAKLDADGREFMGYIVDGAARMKQLIEDLLAYSRVGTRGAGLEKVDSGTALDKALANLRAAREASGAEVTRGDMPQVIADGAQLVQLFQNLIGNAMKFRAKEPPRIHVEAQDQAEAWVFTVKDNGIGLDVQYSDRIFLMFQRLHNKAEYAGTGIGLAICKKIVERHGGRIWVDSRPGEGATFGFTLPRNQGGAPT